MAEKIAVIILNFNGLKFLPDCLGSLEKTDYPKEDLEIIVVDNDSRDNSVFFIKENFPEVKIIENQKNEGFAKGNNIGIKKALEEPVEFIVLLNQDTKVHPQWLTELVRVAQKEASAGAVQARLMMWPEKERINSLGNEIHFLGFGFTAGYKALISRYHLEKKEITYPSGAAVLLKSKVLKEVGLFDEDLFSYHEDLDLGWRARLLGYKIFLAPASVVWHQYEFRRSIAKFYYMERNRFLVMLKNYKWPTLLIICPALILMELGLLIFSFKNGFWPEKVRVYCYFLRLKNWRRIFKKRKIIQKYRKVKDKDLLQFFVGEIKFQDITSPFLEKLANPFFNLYFAVSKKLIFW